MWLTRQLGNGIPEEEIQRGKITLTQPRNMGAAGTREVRNAVWYAPAGIAGVPVSGEEVLMIPAQGETVCAGVRMQPQGLEPGELRLFSRGGGEIRLKNNGEIVLNSVVITPEGVIRGAVLEEE